MFFWDIFIVFYIYSYRVIYPKSCNFDWENYGKPVGFGVLPFFGKVTKSSDTGMKLLPGSTPYSNWVRSHTSKRGSLKPLSETFYISRKLAPAS